MSRKLMQALHYDSYGGGSASLKHVEVPVPSPNKNEVLLKLDAITINPVDWKIQKGLLRPLFLPRQFPHIPCTDVAGEVVEVGPQVKDFKVGDKVVAKLTHQVLLFFFFFPFPTVFQLKMITNSVFNQRVELEFSLLFGDLKNQGIFVIDIDFIPSIVCSRLLPLWALGEGLMLLCMEPPVNGRAVSAAKSRAPTDMTTTQSCSKIRQNLTGMLLFMIYSVNYLITIVCVVYAEWQYGGGFAEFAVASESLTAARPSEVLAAEAAALPIAGLTAHDALTQVAGVKLDGSGQPKNILITAASGGVGHYAVQLAKLGNTHVTATCGARNIDFVKSLGADEVLDYRTPEGAALTSPSGRKYDAVIHCTTGIPWSTFDPNLTENGKVVDLTPSLSSLTTFALKKLTFSKKQLVPFFVTVKREGLEYLVQLVKDGKLKTVIDSKFPLSKAEDAWAKSIDGHATGKIIVEP
ncbi:hypothetical protein TanjilG_16342 [Lupinus angustifolius]|uniref:Enoyl reductase (ER) domain-containing protein n=1 Tax=Lupinus angustifolius TaxID=3871 RepID=A0A1J7I1X4_LUPAN|nr:hypothetical protein TanjilG_16342 [Lupinus angustifolius]